MERAVCGLKMMGEPVVSVFSSRSSEIPGASAPGAWTYGEGGDEMFYLKRKQADGGLERTTARVLARCPDTVMNDLWAIKAALTACFCRVAVSPLKLVCFILAGHTLIPQSLRFRARQSAEHAAAVKSDRTRTETDSTTLAAARV